MANGVKTPSGSDAMNQAWALKYGNRGGAKAKRKNPFGPSSMGPVGIGTKTMPGGLGPAAPRRGMGMGSPMQSTWAGKAGPNMVSRGVTASRPQPAPLPGRSFEQYRAKGGNMNQQQFMKTGGAGAAQKAAMKSGSPMPAVGKPMQRVIPGAKRTNAQSMPRRQTKYSA